MTGRVSLVGAGPGDPDLLTRKAVRRLAEADLVLYDALVSSDVLAMAPRACRVSVGKRAGHPAITQSAINRLMIRAANRGLRIVRLKGGDPFVLGRGGEEALALAHSGVPFEIVPGVTSAVAAPALAGIPVTHRGLSSAVLVISGHSASVYRPILGGLRPGSLTIVVLMGFAQRSAIAQSLIEYGWPADTLAAAVLGASWAGESVWTGTLGNLESGALEDSSKRPGTLIIGSVVALAGALGIRHGATPGECARQVRQPIDDWRPATAGPDLRRRKALIRSHHTRGPAT